MTEEQYLGEAIRSCPIYEPGRPVETVARELGLDPQEIVKLASNENPLGASPLAREAVMGAVERLHEYPDGGSFALRERISRELELPPDWIVPANGSNEALEMVATAYLGPGLNAVMGEYGFIVYRLATLHAKATPRPAAMPDLRQDLSSFRALIDADTRIVFLARPNNPTGDIVPADELMAFVEDLPDHVLFCLDEAYLGYDDDAVDLRPLMQRGRRVICTRTFSKIHGLAGLRVGYAYGPPDIIAGLQRVRQPFNVGTPALMAAAAALDDHGHIAKSRDLNRRGLKGLKAGLDRLGVPCRAEGGNFVLAEVGAARACFEALLRMGVIVRPLEGYGLPSWVRVSTGTAPQNEKFLSALEGWLAGGGES